MRRIIIGVVTASLLTLSLGQATASPPEACLAANPGQPKCTFKITSDSNAQTPTGSEGYGSWQVIVKRGAKKYVMKSAASVNGYAFTFKVGDVVTATAKTPGSWVLVGHTS
ncbi:MAG: hypothetical protein LC808_19575 [Actinobacteria bacterium]|nr:hypothetical protein [Actinomycetota bacterium]